MKLIDCSTPKYPNTFAMVDDEDFDFLNQFDWYPNPSYNTFYLRKNGNGNSRGKGLHAFLLNPDKGFCVDHINGNGLDNQRANLRICSIKQNSQNRRKQANTTSIFKGVHRTKYGTWCAAISANGAYGKQNLGCFKTEIEAALAYNNAAKLLHGEFAKLNIIQEEK